MSLRWSSPNQLFFWLKCAFLLFILDPLAVVDIDAKVWLDENGERRHRQNKHCPDCLRHFASEFDLFNHRISGCKSDRAISIIKVARLNPSRIKVQPSTPNLPIDDNSKTNIKKILQCQGCGTKLQRAYYMRRHKRICADYQKLAVNLTPNELVEEESSLATTHICNDCGIVFTRASSLRRHQASFGCIKRQHFRQYTCSICMRTMTSKESLRNHKLRSCPGLCNTADSTELFTCKGCGTNFNKKFCLLRHQSNTCPALKVLSKAVCYICSTTFGTFDLLREHMGNCHKDQWANSIERIPLLQLLFWNKVFNQNILNDPSFFGVDRN